MEVSAFMPQKLLREELSSLIEARGWQQKDFAEMTGLSPSTISRTLSGSMAISPAIAEIYAKYLDLDPEETVRRAFIDCELRELLKKYQRYPSILKLIRALEDFSCIPMIYERERI